MSEAIGKGFPISFLLICWCWMLAGGARYQWGCCFFAFCILTKWLGVPKSKAGHVLSPCLLYSILLSPVSQGLVGFSTLWHGPLGLDTSQAPCWSKMLVMEPAPVPVLWGVIAQRKLQGAEAQRHMIWGYC